MQNEAMNQCLHSSKKHPTNMTDIIGKFNSRQLWGCARAMRASLAGSDQLHRGVGVGYRSPISSKTSKINELDQCHSRMVPEIFSDQVRVKWETLKD